MSIFSQIIETPEQLQELTLGAIERVSKAEVESRLGELGLDWSLLEVVKVCVASHGGCTANDPPGAPGYESWRAGVRTLREIYLPRDWERDDSGGFSTIVNHERRVRVAMMNADGGAGILGEVPQNRSRKGACSERAATTNASYSLPGSEAWPVPNGAVDPSTYTTWHLCVYISEATIRAELSLLNDFDAGYFTGVHEKIVLVGDGEWDNPMFRRDDDSEPDVDIEIKRK
jgi:hypothetical protein